MSGRGSVSEALALIRDVPGFPKPDVVFKDIAPLLGDPAAFRTVVEALADTGRDESGRPVVDKVIGIEARGFILAAPVALALGAGFVPVRKAGKLPGPIHAETYALEYAEATIELQADALSAGDRVLVLDDVLATGGTVAATLRLLDTCSVTPVAVAVLLELTFLDGRAKLGDVPVHALQQV